LIVSGLLCADVESRARDLWSP